MALRLIYQVFAKLLSWMVLHARSDRGWLGRELARWRLLAGRRRGLCSAGFPVGCATPVAMTSVLRFQLPPVEPCMRFSRTRLTDVLHRRCSA